MKRFVLALALVSTLACAHRIPPPVIVEVPVAVSQAPPPELLVPINPQLPEFIAPSDPLASSALTTEGERYLRALINDLLARIEAWKVWALTPIDPPQ